MEKSKGAPRGPNSTKGQNDYVSQWIQNHPENPYPSDDALATMLRLPVFSQTLPAFTTHKLKQLFSNKRQRAYPHLCKSGPATGRAKKTSKGPMSDQSKAEVAQLQQQLSAVQQQKFDEAFQHQNTIKTQHQQNVQLLKQVRVYEQQEGDLKQQISKLKEAAAVDESKISALRHEITNLEEQLVRQHAELNRLRPPVPAAIAVPSELSAPPVPLPRPQPPPLPPHRPPPPPPQVQSGAACSSPTGGDHQAAAGSSAYIDLFASGRESGLEDGDQDMLCLHWDSVSQAGQEGAWTQLLLPTTEGMSEAEQAGAWTQLLLPATEGMFEAEQPEAWRDEGEQPEAWMRLQPQQHDGAPGGARGIDRSHLAGSNWDTDPK